MPALYYSWRAVRVLWLSCLFFLVLGVQRACELVSRSKSPALCLFSPAAAPAQAAPAPGRVSWPVAVFTDTSALDRKRLPRSYWRGFAGPAYHAGAWPRPARVPRDSAGRVIRQLPAL